MGCGDAGIGHQAVELAAVGAGGVQAQQVAAGAGCLGIDLVGGARGGDRDVAAGDGWGWGWRAQGRMQRYRRRGGVAEGQPFADLQHAADDVAVLEEWQLVASDGAFGDAGQQGEERVMMPRRDCGEVFRPDRGGGGQGELRRAAGLQAAVGEGEIGGGGVAFDREGDGPGAAPCGQDRVCGAGGVPEVG